MKKKIYYVDENDLDGQRWAARAIDFGVGLSVTAAINCLYYAYGCLLERRDLFRLKAKRWGNSAVDAAGRMENRIKSIMQDKSYWEDYTDKVIDESDKDVNLFREAIENELIKANFPDARLFSFIECARVLLEMSVMQFDCVIETAEERYGHNYKSTFGEFRAGDVFRAWDQMCDELYGGYNINLNTQQVIDAFENINRKFGRGEYVDACNYAAMENNPDFTENDILVRE